jgi:hypothetical protein
MLLDKGILQESGGTKTGISMDVRGTVATTTTQYSRGDGGGQA